MSTPTMVDRDKTESIPEAANPVEMHAVAKQVGPILIRLLNDRGWLMPKEWQLLRAIKIICPCHYTDHPKKEFSPNEETCETCGRQM